MGGTQGAYSFSSKPKRRRVATENAITKVNPSEPNGRALYHCNYCQKDISNVVRVKCAECSEVDLCVECFSVGVEPHPHKANHAYHVIDNLSFPLLSHDWGADEELLLLESVETYGLGNWTEVAEHVGTKSKLQCHKHYFDLYVNSPTSPLPDMSRVIGKERSSLPEKESEAATATAGNAADDKTIEGAVAQHDSNKNSETIIDGTDGNKLSSRPGGEVNQAEGNSVELTGYNVKRDEFDPEYDNDAELPLSEMEFRESDTEAERQVKLRMIAIYNSRLQERARRKQFILERGLLNVKKQQGVERKRSQPERELHGMLRVFARFLSPAEYEILLEGLAAESRIRTRIEELKEYRRNGIHTLAEGEIYDAEKHKRQAEYMMRLKAIETDCSNSKAMRANRYLSRDSIPAAPTVSSGSIPRELQKLHAAGDTQPKATNGQGASSSVGARRKIVMPLDLTSLPGIELLSKREREICTNCRLLPVHYLSIKEALMRVSMNDPKQVLKRADVKAMFKMDPVKAMRIYDLLVQNGWIKESAGDVLNKDSSAGSDSVHVKHEEGTTSIVHAEENV